MRVALGRCDDLRDICQVVEIHLSQLVVVGQSRRLPNQKTATDAVALQFIPRPLAGVRTCAGDALPGGN